MGLKELLNRSLELMDRHVGSIEDRSHAASWQFKDLDGTMYISQENLAEFSQTIENIFTSNEFIYKNFGREKMFQEITSRIARKRDTNQRYTESEAQSFFAKEKETKPFSKYVITQISGVRLEKVDKIQLSIFEIGKQSNLKANLGKPDGYYIAIKLDNIYDESLDRKSVV